jgi:hypothetical protein
MNTNTTFDSLPELGAESGYKLVVRNGQLFRVPSKPDYRALMREPHEPASYIDTNGAEWEVGWIDGRQVRRRR